MARYSELLSEFALHAGLDAIDAFLTSQEVIIDDVTIGLIHEGDPQADGPGDLIYFASAGCLAQRARTVDVYRYLLGINAFWQGTAGYTVGLQRACDSVIFSGRLPLSCLDGETLERVLCRFARVVREWADMLEPDADGDVETGAEADGESGFELKPAAAFESDHQSDSISLPDTRLLN